jgi:hypothetical protein
MQLDNVFKDIVWAAGIVGASIVLYNGFKLWRAPRQNMETRITALEQRMCTVEKSTKDAKDAADALRKGINILCQCMRVFFDTVPSDKTNPRIDQVKEVLDQYLINR